MEKAFCLIGKPPKLNLGGDSGLITGWWDLSKKQATCQIWFFNFPVASGNRRPYPNLAPPLKGKRYAEILSQKNESFLIGKMYDLG